MNESSIDDLLETLSADLGLSDFDVDVDANQRLFSGLLDNDNEAVALSPESLASFKSEPTTDSDHSSSEGDVVLFQQPHQTRPSPHQPPLSPPYSPPSLPPSVVTVPTPNFKIPIPKVTKPSQAPVAVLTSAPVIIKTEPMSSPLTTALPTVQTVSVHQKPTLQSQVDLKTLKRQQRMIKNRESACLSRKKKKEYVTNLEEQLNQLGKENRDLRAENETLKAKVRELEAEKSLWTDSVLNASNAKKATAVFAIVFLVVFTAAPLNKDNLRPMVQKSALNDNLDMVDKVVGDISRIRGGGRSLLWAPQPDSLNKTYTNSSSSPICPMFLNQSESIRLNSQLRGWFKEEPESKAKKAASTVDSEPSTSLGHYVRPAIQRLTGSIYHMLVSERQAAPPVPPQPATTPRRQEGAIRIYDSSDGAPRFSFESFFEAIERRDDTFYVVSFSGDHLLLPAATHNATSARPKMSLLLPSVGGVPLNDSIKNHVAMMQIDCEVMNTRLVYIKEDAIPAHMHVQRSGNVSLQRNESNNGGLNATNNAANEVEDHDESFREFAVENRIYDTERGGNGNRIRQIKRKSRPMASKTPLYKRPSSRNPQEDDSTGKAKQRRKQKLL